MFVQSVQTKNKVLSLNNQTPQTASFSFLWLQGFSIFLNAQQIQYFKKILNYTKTVDSMPNKVFTKLNEQS